ncbi:MAG TPA: hypothetical protein VFR07_09005 [Mycobacteriales bacterium]|jgi:hypothetical protein|nr:hypothetical protein [Mycobacteriales bacterium]
MTSPQHHSQLVLQSRAALAQLERRRHDALVLIAASQERCRESRRALAGSQRSCSSSS